MRTKSILAGLALGAVLLGAGAAQPARVSPTPPQAPTQLGARPELLHQFYGHMPVGVAVNSKGRIFVSYPTWEDLVPFSIAEIRGGREVPYPNREINTNRMPKSYDNFIGVQGLLVDGKDRLWVLDTGTINLSPILNQQAPKLVGINTNTNQVIKTIRFPANVVPKDTYMNDLRVDLRQGADGVAYITDSGAKTGGIIVVDLATGKSWRKLTGDKTVRAEPKFLSFADGVALLKRPQGGPASYLDLSSDGIAISPDGANLYYTPLASHRLYSVPTAALRDESLSDAQVSAQVRDLGEKGVADGLLEDTAGRVYTTNWEQNAILRRLPNGEFQTVVRDPRLIWPDTLSMQGGYLYIIANQLNRQGGYHHGIDQRTRPYSLFRLRIDAQPVVLK